jgi:hypothetical protein
MKVMIDTGTGIKMWIPIPAFNTYKKKYEAVGKLQAMGGFRSPFNDETGKLVRTINNCNRRIKREYWYSEIIKEDV